MTAGCTGGTSGPKPGVEELVIFGADQIAQQLAKIPAWWAIPLAGLIAVLTYDTTTFCATDPPPVEPLTGADYNSLLQVDSGFAAAAAKLVSSFGNSVWFDLCHCTVGGAPSTTGFPPAPSGVSTNVNGTPLANCPQQSWQGNIPTVAAQGVGITQALFSYVRRGMDIPTTTSTGDNSTVFLPVPHPTQIAFNWQQISPTPHGNTIIVAWFDATGANVSGTCLIATTSGGQSLAMCSPPAGAVLMQVNWQGDQSNTNDCTGFVTAYFVGNCGAISQNSCCQSTAQDPSGMLAQILNAIQLLGTPAQGFGHLLVGPSTSGLTGAGTLAAVGAVGVQIFLDATPTSLGTELGNPNPLFDVGWITPMTSQGPTAAVRVLYQTQVFFFPPTVQSFDYFFHPGVSATATLLDGAP